MTESETKMWFVRAGRNGIYAEHFIQSEVVAIGWGEVGGITPEMSDDEIRRRFEGHWPDEKHQTRITWAGQVKRFLREVAVGDRVTMYDPETRLYHTGNILAPAVLQSRMIDSQERPEFVRNVSWTGSRSRDELSRTTRNTLGSSLTLFLVSKSASNELLGGASGSDLSGTSVESMTSELGESEAEDLLEELISRSEQLVEDKIAALDWQEIQELVAGILRSMGQRTRVSKPGPDRGVDIFASPDGLGLVEPRIFVEVKHRSGRVGSQAVRAFLGGRQKGDRCLYVSTGGFTTDARYEAERSSIPITLISMPELRELLIDYYETLDSVSRSLVPLRKFFLPASE